MLRKRFADAYRTFILAASHYVQSPSTLVCRLRIVSFRVRVWLAPAPLAAAAPLDAAIVTTTAIVTAAWDATTGCADCDDDID